LCAPDGVGVTLISPGRVDTDFWAPIGGPPDGATLTSEKLAEALVWATLQSPGVDVNTIVVRPTGAVI
jgi:NADP-dependent 3-hydroxy acid dehydrogenase YdfG